VLSSPVTAAGLADSAPTPARATLAGIPGERPRQSNGEAMAVVTLHVPGMTSRRLIRIVTARIRDLPGVTTVEVKLDTAVIVVHGTATAGQICVALAEAGFAARDESGQ
jgi:copper chaperone CopZ